MHLLEAKGKDAWIIVLAKESLAISEACNPRLASIASTIATTGLAHVGISPSSIPLNRLSKLIRY